MISIPTVDQLIDSALSADNPVPEQQKVATERVEVEKIDEMEKVASELESWADGIDFVDDEQVKVASAEKYEDSRHRMLKLAMIGTAYRTLQSLEENGHLDDLIEKKAQFGKWLRTRARQGLGSVVASTKKVRKGQIAAGKRVGQKAPTPSAMKRISAKRQKRMVAAGTAIGARRPATIAGRSDVAVAQGRRQAAQARRAATATKATAVKQVAKAEKGQAAAEAGKRTMQLVAGGAAAAGVGGAGLAYGAGRKQERQRQSRRYA